MIDKLWNRMKLEVENRKVEILALVVVFAFHRGKTYVHIEAVPRILRFVGCNIWKEMVFQIGGNEEYKLFQKIACQMYGHFVRHRMRQ